MKHKKIKYWKSFAVLTAIAGMLLTMNFAFGQYEYYDSYSNSNIDYFPMNPIAGTSGISPSAPLAPAPDPKPTAEKTPASIPCSNKPKPNPQNTRSVEVRDSGGKVFYLSPPKEEVAGARAYPETSQKIFKDATEIGLITVDNQCYPKYGYIQNIPLTEDQTIPSNKTAAILDPATGKVYNEITTSSDFTPSPAAPTAAKGCSKKTALLFNEQQPYQFCYRSDAILVGIMPNTSDLKVSSSDGPVSVFTIMYYKNSATADDLMKNWYRVKKKNVKNKHRVSGFTYELRDADSSSPPHNGAFLINTKSDENEFVHIQFTDAPDYPSKPFRFPKEFKKLIETFRFL